MEPAMTKVRGACCCTATPGGGGGGSDSNKTNKYDRLRRKGLGFITSLFKLTRRKNHCLTTTGMRIDSGPNNGGSSSSDSPRNNMQHRSSPRLVSSAGGGVMTSPRVGGGGDADMSSRISSTLSVAAVDVVLACRQTGGGAPTAKASPSHSILTLTPGRTRNIDQDMEALRLSRQDNPYLQILASKENLIESTEESESDDTTLMSQEFRDTDPLTLAQVHEHLVRSPPPASWTRNSMFHFPHQHQQQDSPGGGGHCRNNSPKSMMHRSTEDHTGSEGSMEIRDRHSHTFSLLNPTPIRSLSEVRRLHRSAEDSVQLMSSE